jgi:hypothetical protein
MLHNFISNILYIITGFFSPQVTASNTLNPVLALGTRGYWIQSHILSLPDRYGFFSPGSPRLQVYQAFLFIFLSIMIVSTSFAGAFLVFAMSCQPDRKPIWQVVVYEAAIVFGVVAMIWAMECHSENRTPDYVWEDWKLRKD